MNNLVKTIQLAKDLDAFFNLYSNYNHLKYLYNITLICNLYNSDDNINNNNIKQIINIAKSYGFNFNYCTSFDELRTQIFIAKSDAENAMKNMIDKKLVDKSLETIIYN